MPHTHILLKFYESNGLDENTIKALINQEKFEGLLYKYQPHKDGIYTLTIYSSETMAAFEKKRNLLLGYLKKVTDYLSISHDSATKYYIEEIGKTIYDLERSFRTLVEFVFLNKFKSRWIDVFPTLGHDRKTKRGEPLTKLDNPLDDWDFVHLSRFVKEQITFMDQALQIRLKSIGQSILNIDPSNDLEQIKDSVLLKINELINLPGKNKKNDLKYTELYTHLTPSLASDWEKLYSLRNLWAHNTAIITRGEFEDYNKVYKSVLNNLHTEITVISLFSGEQRSYLEMGQDRFKIILYKSNFEGRATVHLKGQFVNEQGQNISFKKNSITFYEILTLYKEILQAANDTGGLTEISSCFEYNPFLEEDFIELGKYVAGKFANLGPETLRIQSFLSSEDYEVFTNDTKVLMSEDVDTYLREIFKEGN
ncbi:hypothetical protein [Priestia megaterium]|uniref:hypothetical protein n=1 Tax=Priestia megaterium TaxID=1404 RepID=UPI00207A20A5|nr:hypothetical protein [Priestia megaterium]USL34838.1 hypothetical protein LIT34_18790 [Priestia megaterium]